MKAKHNKKIQDMLTKTRSTAGKTVEQVASDLGVSAKTIYNWEEGLSEPNASQFLNWFDVLGLNPVPYIYEYYYPTFETIAPTDNDKRIIQAFKEVSKSLSPRLMRIIMVATKRNGSDIECLWELFLAYMQNNQQNKILIATDVVTSYELNDPAYPDTVQPNIQKIKLAIEKAKEAYRKGHKSYVLRENEK